MPAIASRAIRRALRRASAIAVRSRLGRASRESVDRRARAFVPRVRALTRPSRRREKFAWTSSTVRGASMGAGQARQRGNVATARWDLKYVWETRGFAIIWRNVDLGRGLRGARAETRSEREGARKRALHVVRE